MTGYPRRYVVFDTETWHGRAASPKWGLDQTLRLGVAKLYDPDLYGDAKPVYHGFETADEFLTMMRMHPMSQEPIVMLAHNIGFDLRIVEWFRWVASEHFSLLPPAGMPGAGRYKTPLFICDGKPIIMRFFRPDGQRILIYDSFNWFPVSLAEIGRWQGFEKWGMPPDDATESDWMDYCKRDVDVLDRAMRRLWGWLQCCRVPDWCATPASQAGQVYRMRYGKGRIKKPADMDVLKPARHAYYGGKTECFHIGRYDKMSYQVDINGLYPHVMTGLPYPCAVKSQGDSFDREVSSFEHDPIATVAEVWLDARESEYPVRSADGTIWVSGAVRTILAGPELRRAMSAGQVTRIGRWLTFECDSLFDQYVAWLWRTRMQAKSRNDGIIDRACKSMLNALHGKFGQRDGDWQYRGRMGMPGEFAHGKLIGKSVHHDTDLRCLDGQIWTRVCDREEEQSFVPIAAWCSSYARMYMDDQIDIAGRDNVLYQCNDSLIVTQDGWDRLFDARRIDTGEIGAFKFVEAYEWIDIQGVNQLDTNLGGKHAGIKAGSTCTADGIYEVEEWESMAHSIFRGNVSTVSTRKIYKKPFDSYTRRYVHTNGRTSPWRIDNWDTTPEEQEKLSLPILSKGREEGPTLRQRGIRRRKDPK